MTKQLPEYFVIERDETNPLWDKYVKWLNKTYNQKWGGYGDYYGFDGNRKFKGTNSRHKLEYFENNPTLITLEYWNECINGKEEQFEEGEVVEVLNSIGKWEKRIYQFTNKRGEPICVSIDYENAYSMGNDYQVCSWYGIRKIKKEEPKEIKLTATDSEIEKLKEFLKENNLDINIQ